MFSLQLQERFSSFISVHHTNSNRTNSVPLTEGACANSKIQIVTSRTITTENDSTSVSLSRASCAHFYSHSHLSYFLSVKKKQIESNVKSKSKKSNKGNGRSSHITMSYDLIFMHFFTLKNE